MLMLRYGYADSPREAKALAHRLLTELWLSQFEQPLPPLSTGANGKPYVPGGAHFNLTHTHGFAACLLSDRPVGLDAEWLHRRVSPRLPERLLDAQEQAYAAAHPHGFLRLWTLREAYLKYTGEGLQGFGNHVHFRMNEELPTLPGTTCRFQTLFLPDIVLSICSETDEALKIVAVKKP